MARRRLSSSSIETSTTWGDTGYDCDHCGGRVLRRTDRETGVSDRSCYQCEQCGCQWTLEHRPLRVGKLAACRSAQRGRVGESDEPTNPYAPLGLLVLGAVVLLVLFRFGGGGVLRAAVPLLLVVLVLFLARHGRRQGWW